jgi:hypothetical protein
LSPKVEFSGTNNKEVNEEKARKGAEWLEDWPMEA